MWACSDKGYAINRTIFILIDYSVDFGSATTKKTIAMSKLYIQYRDTFYDKYRGRKL